MERKLQIPVMLKVILFLITLNSVYGYYLTGTGLNENQGMMPTESRFLWNIFVPVGTTTRRHIYCATAQLCCKNQCVSTGHICSNKPFPLENKFCQPSTTSATPATSKVCKNVPKTCPGCKYFDCPGNPAPCVLDSRRAICPEDN